MTKKNFKLVVLVLLLVIINGILFLLYKSFDFKFILLILFPNIAILYGYVFDKKFIKRDYINKILGNIVIYSYLILSTILSIIGMFLKLKNFIFIILQCILLLVVIIIYFYIYTVAKKNKKIITVDKNNSLNYKAWEIDIVSLKGKFTSADVLINKIIDIVKYSPKNSNEATILIDQKIKVSIDTLLTEDVSEEDMLEVLNYVIKLLKEKNQILNLTN